MPGSRAGFSLPPLVHLPKPRRMRYEIITAVILSGISIPDLAEEVGKHMPAPTRPEALTVIVSFFRDFAVKCRKTFSAD